MYNYNAKLNLNGDVKEIIIKNNTFKDTRIIGDYLLYSSNSGNILANTTLNGDSINYTISTSDCVYGENVTVTVNVNDSATGNITVNVDDGQVFKGVIDNGVVIIPLSNLNVGVHNLNVSYSGDSNFLPFNATVCLTVGKGNVGVDVKVDSIVYGDDAVVDVVVDGVGGKVIPTGNVTFYINGIENGTVPINDGKCKYIFSDLSVSIYTINVVYSGDNNYLSSNVTTNLTVGKVNVGVDVKVDSIVYGETAAINVTVKGINDKIVPTGNVTFYINGIENGTVPINDGKCEYIFSDLGAGIYNVSVVYSGDNNYLSSNVTTNLTVGKVNVGVDVKVDSIVYGDDAVVDVVVNGIGGKLVPTGEVIFFVNGIEKGNVHINDVKCDFILSDLGAGIYNVSVVYSGDNNYLSSNVTTNLTVNPINVTLIPTVLTTYYDSGKCFQIKVVDNNNESISGLKIALKVFTGSSYKTVYVTTDNNGIAKYGVSKLSIGTHNVTVMVSNSNYSASIKTSSIKIAKSATKITRVSAKVIKNHKYFYVKLTTKSGKALANKVVTMKSSVSGKTYKIKTNSKGIAKIDLWITYTLGRTHKYTFKYVRCNYYNSCTKTFKIKIIK